jgi:hypothetical protein
VIVMSRSGGGCGSVKVQAGTAVGRDVPGLVSHAAKVPLPISTSLALLPHSDRIKCQHTWIELHQDSPNQHACEDKKAPV